MFSCSFTRLRLGLMLPNTLQSLTIARLGSQLPVQADYFQHFMIFFCSKAPNSNQSFDVLFALQNSPFLYSMSNRPVANLLGPFQVEFCKQKSKILMFSSRPLSYRSMTFSKKKLIFLNFQGRSCRRP